MGFEEVGVGVVIQSQTTPDLQISRGWHLCYFPVRKAPST